MAVLFRGRSVEFLLLVGCGVLLLMVLKRINAADSQARDLAAALAGVSDKLDQVLRRTATLPPDAGPVPEAAMPARRRAAATTGAGRQ